MSHDKHQHEQSSQPEQETEPLQQIEAFHHFMHDCRACQQEVEPHWQFCAHCGTRLATRCPGCGTPLPPVGARSCPHCGLEIPQVNG
jgi:rRNA maturation endonuclease Nob1